MSFYQRSLALFFAELAGPPVTVADAKEQVGGEAVKGLRVAAPELGYSTLWFVRNRVWQVVRAGGAVERSAVPGNAVIYQVGTEVVGDLLRIAQDAYLRPGGDRARIEGLMRTYEGFLQQNIPQGLAALKAYDGVERARVLLEELRREYQAKLAAPAPAPVAEAFVVPEPEPIVYDLDDDLEPTFESTAAFEAEPTEWPPVPAVLPDNAPPPIGEPVVMPAPTPAPAAEPVTVVPQTTASFVFDQALVNLLGRLGTAYPWLLPDYGRHGDGMGVRVTLPAGFSVVFTHLGSEWTAASTPEAAPAVRALLADDDAVFGWAVPRIRDLTAAYGARLGAERPADAAQLFQRVADLS